MKKKIWITIGVVSLILLMIGVSVYRQVFAKGPSVKVAQISQEEVSSLLMIPGTVKLEEEQVVYSSPEKGELKEFLVKEGQTVKKGSVLAKLQNPQLDLEREQNKLAIESANLKITQLENKIKQLKDKESTLAKQVGKEEAKKQLAPELEQAEMEKKLANIELKQASLQKDLLSKRQSELEIKSSIDGVVLSVQDPNTSSREASNLEPLIHIGKLEGLTAAGLLSEYDSLKVSNGQKVTLRSDAVPEQEWQGQITMISVLPQQQNQSGLQSGSQAVQYPVTVKISGDTKALKPGFQLIMEIETEKKMAMVLPVNSLHDDGDQPYVYLLKDGKARKQKVKTGITSGEKMEILDGVKKSDKVIVQGPEQLKDGLEVKEK